MKCLPLVPLPEDEVIYRIPGGGAEKDESPMETARRELKQETGLKIPGNIKSVCVYVAINGDHIKYGLLVNRLDLNGSIRKGVTEDGDIRIVGYEWLSIDEAIELVRPGPKGRSHHDTLLNAKVWLEKNLLFGAS